MAADKLNVSIHRVRNLIFLINQGLNASELESEVLGVGNLHFKFSFPISNVSG